MILTINKWAKIRDQFTDDEKATLRSAIGGETICPPGWSLDTNALDAGLADKLAKACEGAN